jgi:hypothetical protein
LNFLHLLSLLISQLLLTWPFITGTLFAEHVHLVPHFLFNRLESMSIHKLSERIQFLLME